MYSFPATSRMRLPSPPVEHGSDLVGEPEHPEAAPRQDALRTAL